MMDDPTGAEAEAPLPVVGGPELASAPVDGPPGEAALDEERTLVEALLRRGRTTSTLTLTEAQADGLSLRIQRDFLDASAALDKWKQYHAAYLANWRGVPEPKDFPFEGAANIMVPMTSTMVETWKARIMRALFGGERIAQLSSMGNRVDPETLQELTDWFQWELNEIVQARRAFYTITHGTVLNGIDCPFAEYRRDVRRLTSLTDYEIHDDVPLLDQIHEQVTALFEGQQPDIRTTGQGEFEVQYRDAGERRMAKVCFSIDEVTERLVAECEKDELVFDGVKIESINVADDLVVVNTAADIEDLPFFGTRWWLSWTDFVRGQAAGRYLQFDEDGQAKLKEGAVDAKGQGPLKAAAGDKTQTEISQPITVISDQQEGTQSTDPAATDLARKWLEVYRWEGWWSPDEIEEKVGDPTIGLEQSTPTAPVQVAVWMEALSRKIIRVQRLEELNKDGLRTPVKFDFIIQPGRFFSIGLPEWLQHMQEEVNGIHNQRLDAGLLTNVPFFLFEPAAGFNVDLVSIQPGKGIPVKSVQKVLFPQLKMQSYWSFQEEANVWNLATQHAGLGETAMGSLPSKRMTASEVVGTQGAVDLRTELILTDIFRATRVLLYRVFSLYQQHARDGRMYEVVGQNGAREIRSLKRDRLQGKYSLQLTANLQQLSASLERETATNMLSIFFNQIFLQMGIVKPDTVYAALQKLMRALNYNGVPIHKPDMVADSDPPWVEQQRMLDGEQQVSPSPTENFAEHLTVHSQALVDPGFLELSEKNPAARQALQEHIQHTLQLQQQVMLMRQQQMAMATAAKANMDKMGIRPGLPGSSTDTEAQPGTQAEGVEGAPE